MKVVAILMGIQTGNVKYPCHLCEWDRCARTQHQDHGKRKTEIAEAQLEETEEELSEEELLEEEISKEGEMRDEDDEEDEEDDDEDSEEEEEEEEESSSVFR